MKKIIVNQDNLRESDITDVEKRVKILIINSKNEILLGYSFNEYQFPGGHVKKQEKLIDALNREIKEEVGINLKLNIEPFACLIEYYKNWPCVNENKKLELYYYEVKTDTIPNINNTHYTKEEKKGNFELKFIPFDKLEEELLNNVKNYADPKGITTEMLTILETYKEKNNRIIE